MEIAYYPGCTLKTSAKNFESSSIAVANHLGITFKELSRWNCCGTVYSLASDDLMKHLAPVRVLIRAQEDNKNGNRDNKLVTLCSMCYNTIKMANHLVKNDEEKLDTINQFMDEEPDYEADVKVLHFLQLLDEIGIDKIKENTKKSLDGLNLACYYGCYLLRPEEASIDEEPEAPSIMERVMESAGARTIEYPFKNECCGSYLTVTEKNYTAERTYKIISSVVNRGADAIVLSCPLCAFNLDRRQKQAKDLHADMKSIPVFYFPQLLGLAFGIKSNELGFNMHYVDPRPLLKEKGLIKR